MTTAFKPLKREVPLPTVKPVYAEEDEYRTVTFSARYKLLVRNHGHSDQFVAEVARQFCSADYSWGIATPHDSDGINEVLADSATNVAKSRRLLTELLDYPTEDRIAEICPLWYPSWALRFIKEQAINEADCFSDDELVSEDRLYIDLKSIHKKLIARIEEEFPALFEDPEYAR